MAPNTSSTSPCPVFIPAKSKVKIQSIGCSEIEPELVGAFAPSVLSRNLSFKHTDFRCNGPVYGWGITSLRSNYREHMAPTEVRENRISGLLLVDLGFPDLLNVV